jgi:hypothetical protein
MWLSQPRDGDVIEIELGGDVVLRVIDSSPCSDPSQAGACLVRRRGGGGTRCSVRRSARRQAPRRRRANRSGRHRILATAVASYIALPEPMFARSGRLPASGDDAYEVSGTAFRRSLD